MKTLFDAQVCARDFLLNSVDRFGSALNTSGTGTGKTVVSCHMAMAMDTDVAVVCPKSVTTSWRRELEAHNIDPSFVINYEMIRRGNCEFLSKKGKRIMEWNLPKKTTIIFDESHNMKSPFTQNSMLLISATMQKHRSVLLSATASEDPTEMRASGYALKLHALNKNTIQLKGWTEWMKHYGCWQDSYKRWRSGPKAKLRELREVLYADRAFCIRQSDLPEAFRENHIVEEPIDFAACANIRKFYDEAGFTPEIIERVIEEGISPEEMEENGLTKLLRARQFAEACKVPEIVSMTNDLVSEQKSVVIFVNFSETVQALLTALPEAGLIIGGQTKQERDDQVDAFGRDEIRVMIANVAAGGTGVDGLQDLRGEYQRVSLISPSFNAKQYLQVLGRLHRANSKSDCIQKILIAADTVEEYVLKSIKRKLANLEALHGL